MRIQSTGAAFLLSALLPSLASAITFDCAHINVKSNKYDFKPLGGIHQVAHATSGNETGSYVTNTTYLLDICKPLGKAASSRPEGKCESSKNICGFVDKHPADGNGGESWGFAIAGLGQLGEGAKDPEFTLLKEVNEELEGVRLKVAGGKYRSSVEGKDKPAAAVIDFRCDLDRSGLEGISTTENTGEAKKRTDEDAKDASLQFKSFGPDDDDTYILKLDWRTRYACEDHQRGKQSSSSSWGFFTWLIIIVFLAASAYLIFGSWLNYNRHGARGWDLLPHGDTLRDVPYIFQDWFRRVVNTLQGGGTRGGYSAV